MSKRLFVGGLPYDMTEDKLLEVFTACGRVEKVKIMVDRATGRSKGFGFIEMATELEGQAAILKFDNTQLGPRKISVKEAKPAESHHKPAAGQRRQDGQSRGRQPNNNRNQDRRFSNNNGGHSNNGGPSNGSGPRPSNPFNESRSPRGPQGFGERQPRGNFARPNSGSGEPRGFGGGFGQRPQGRPSTSPTQGNGPRERSDWRSELGFGTGQPQRRDFRRGGQQRDSRRSPGGPRQVDDNFGNR